MSDELRKRMSFRMLNIDPEIITTVIESAGRTVTTPEGATIKPRWSDVNIVNGERLGYSDATPGVLYWMKKATR